jgi:hypothetical protein
MKITVCIKNDDGSLEKIYFEKDVVHAINNRGILEIHNKDNHCGKLSLLAEFNKWEYWIKEKKDK